MSDAKNTDPSVVRLSTPITWGEEQITELRFREPTVADMKKTDRAKGDVEKTAILIAALSGIAPPAVDRLSAKDMQACGDVISRFLD